MIDLTKIDLKLIKLEISGESVGHGVLITYENPHVHFFRDEYALQSGILSLERLLQSNQWIEKLCNK